MVIDTSAVTAILRNEPERSRFVQAIGASDARMMSTASLVEVAIVIERRHGAEGVRELDQFLATAGIDLVALDLEQANIARRAFTRFGKGRHRAGLNYGDCFSYALAIAFGEPLLFKGDDFVHTDVEPLDFGALS